MTLEHWFGKRFHSSGKRARKRRPRRLSLETLECRVVPAAVNWIASGSGNWDAAANWSTGQVPGSADDVTISTYGTVTIKSGDGESVHSLTTSSGATLSITGGSLTVAAASTLAGPLTMTGG